MPTARESLLEAAREAVEQRPWPVVRMVEVAAAAGVSRQTLYNEFGDKAGLGSALVERQVGRFLDGFTAGLTGVADALAQAPTAGREDGAGDALDRIAAWMADWVVRSARRDRLVRATLTGCQSSDLPPCAGQPGQLVAELRDRATRVLTPRTAGAGADPDAGTAADAPSHSSTRSPTRADADASADTDTDAAEADASADARADVELTDDGDAGGGAEASELAGRCETAIRLALSHVVAPAPAPEGAEPAPVPLPRAGWRLSAAELPPDAAAPVPSLVQSPLRRSRVASSRRSE